MANGTQGEMMKTKRRRVIVRDHLKERGNGKARKEILEGLKETPKTIPCVYLYDERGSELFERITRLDEYYLPRKEIPLLRRMARRMGDAWEGVDIVELGSGDCSKISVILEAIPPEFRRTVRYVPLDVSRAAIEKSAAVLLERFEGLCVKAMVADFRAQMDLIPQERPRVFCFLGSTLGNLTVEDAVAFLTDLKNVMQAGDNLLLGLDMVKEKRILEDAYNDEKGITARFNKNILNVVNRHLRTEFDTENFDHVAFYDEDLCRIEMHLKARRSLSVTSPFSSAPLCFRSEETIHTENCHKFTDKRLRKLAASAGLQLADLVKDGKEWFSVARLVK